MVNGGVAEVGNGIVDIEGASSEEVSFLAAGSGGLDLDDAKLYTGKVVGFGGASHANHSQFIDLTAVTYVSGVVSESYHASKGSGVLTVTSSGTVVATIDFVGAYTSGNFHLTSGAGGSGTIITDPAVPNGGEVHSANIALFGNYMAASFVSAAGGHGSTVHQSPQANEQSHLAYPHHPLGVTRPLFRSRWHLEGGMQQAANLSGRAVFRYVAGIRYKNLYSSAAGTGELVTAATCSADKRLQRWTIVVASSRVFIQQFAAGEEKRFGKGAPG